MNFENKRFFWSHMLLMKFLHAIWRDCVLQITNIISNSRIAINRSLQAFKDEEPTSNIAGILEFQGEIGKKY